MDGKLIAYYSYVSCARYDGVILSMHSLKITIFQSPLIPIVCWRLSMDSALYRIWSGTHHLHQLFCQFIIIWWCLLHSSQLIYIYIHTKPLFTIQSKYFKKWKNIDTTNSHSASSNCRKLPMYQPFMSWPYIPRSWGESVSKEAIAMDVRTAIGDCGANSCCNHRAINPWTCAWLCPGSNIKKRNN